MPAPNGNTALIYTQPAAAGNLLITTSQQRCTASDWDLSRQCCSNDLLLSVIIKPAMLTDALWFTLGPTVNYNSTSAHHLLQCLKSLYQNQQRSKMLFDFHFKADCTQMKQSSQLNCTTLTAAFHVALLCINSTHSIQCAYLVYCNHDHKKTSK